MSEYQIIINAAERKEQKWQKRQKWQRRQKRQQLQKRHKYQQAVDAA